MSGSKRKKFIYKTNHKLDKIESVFVFDDGDFLLFETDHNSSLYDKNTLKLKIVLDITLKKDFFYLTEEEFGLYIKNYYIIYKFKNNRTEYSEIQKLYLNEYEQGLKLMRISNGDILFFKYFTGGIIRSLTISIYKNVKNDSSINSNNSYLYQKQEQFNINNCDEIIEMNDKELIGYRKVISSELLILTKFNSNTVFHGIERPIFGRQKGGSLYIEN